NVASGGGAGADRHARGEGVASHLGEYGSRATGTRGEAGAGAAGPAAVTSTRRFGGEGIATFAKQITSSFLIEMERQYTQGRKPGVADALVAGEVIWPNQSLNLTGAARWFRAARSRCRGPGKLAVPLGRKGCPTAFVKESDAVTGGRYGRKTGSPLGRVESE